MLAINLTMLALVACNAEPDPGAHWHLHVIDNTFEGADGVDANDIDADGDMDLLVGWEESGRAALYENPGPDNVLAAWRRIDVSTGLDVRKIEDATFADFNGDGRVDAIVSATENRNEKVNIHWLVDRERIFNDDSWKSTSIDLSVRLPFIKIAIGQISGVGANDIVAGSKDDTKPGQLLWYQAPEKPVFANAAKWKAGPIADIHWANTVQILDIDEDGDNDILMSDWTVLAWFENPGDLAEAGTNRSGWARHVISNEASSNFANCAVDKNDPAQLHIIVSAVTARTPIEIGDPLFYSIKKDVDDKGRWSGDWIESKLSAIDAIPSEVEENDYDLKGVVCGNIDNNANTDLVISASGYGNGIFALMNYNHEAGDQKLSLKVIADDVHNTHKGIKHDNLLLDDLDGDGDLDVITTEENGNTGSYFFPRGLGLVWYENPL